MTSQSSPSGSVTTSLSTRNLRARASSLAVARQQLLRRRVVALHLRDDLGPALGLRVDALRERRHLRVRLGEDLLADGDEIRRALGHEEVLLQEEVEELGARGVVVAALLEDALLEELLVVCIRFLGVLQGFFDAFLLGGERGHERGALVVEELLGAAGRLDADLRPHLRRLLEVLLRVLELRGDLLDARERVLRAHVGRRVVARGHQEERVHRPHVRVRLSAERVLRALHADVDRERVLDDR